MNSSRHLNEQRAESASYALLRRLAPMLSHDLAGVLQPLSMMALVLEKRLQNVNLDHAALLKSSSHFKTQVREAARACVELIGWLTPNSSDSVSVAAGIEETTALIVSSLSFKGFNFVNNVGDMQAELPHGVMRSVYMAALLAITDYALAPADVLLEARQAGSVVVLTIWIVPTLGAVIASDPAPYRNIEWDDVEALAALHAVQVICTDSSVELHIELHV